MGNLTGVGGPASSCGLADLGRAAGLGGPSRDPGSTSGKAIIGTD